MAGNKAFMRREDKSTFRIQSMASHECGDKIVNISPGVRVVCSGSAAVTHGEHAGGRAAASWTQ